MRADRLVTILLMLQRCGTVTAIQVAEELEVSERTARRDLEALGTAGLPVYSTSGRGGGWRLLGNGRTDLSGFTALETRALFMAAGATPAPTAELRSALRKLTRALPEPFRDGAEDATNRLIVESPGWRESDEHQPQWLVEIQTAVLGEYQIDLDYHDKNQTNTSRRVHPLGLISKGSRWYLVAATENGMRTFRLDRVNGVHITDEAIEVPAGFALADAWAEVHSHVASLQPPVQAHGTVLATHENVLRFLFPNHCEIAPAKSDKRFGFRVSTWSVDRAAGLLAGLGSAAIVEGDPEVVQRIREIAVELVQTYG